MKIKEIASLLGVPPSTLHDWKKNPEKKNLAAILTAMPKEVALEFIKDATKKQAPKMLLATVNCSIGNSTKHLKASDIKKLLSGNKPETSVEKYALDVIKTEATQEEIISFATYYRISKKSISKILNG